jgi:predicted MFS family arabinose efflux permease
VGDAIPAQRRGQAMGILMLGFALASVLGVPGGLYLASAYQWNTPFIVLACLCVLVFVGALFVVPNFKAHLENYKVSSFVQIVSKVLSDKNRRMALLLTIVMMPAHFFIIPFLTDYFTKNCGFDYKSTVPLVYVVGGLLSAVCSPLIGKLSDKIGRFPVLAVLTLLSVFPLVGIPNLETHNKVILLCFTAGFLILNASVQQFAVSVTSLIGGFIVVQDENGLLHNYHYLGYLSLVFSALVLLVFRSVKVIAEKSN